MSALDHKQTFAAQQPMSDKGQKRRGAIKVQLSNEPNC